MRVVIVNGVARPDLATPDALLSEYRTLTGWGEAVRAAGASQVHVIQRFDSTADFARNGVEYRFRCDRTWFGRSSAAWRARLVEEIETCRPHVVHVNGTASVAALLAIRRSWDASPIVVQHHGEGFHRDALRRNYTRRGLACADAVVFSTVVQAEPWRAAGLLDDRTQVFAVMESSTTFSPLPRHAACAQVMLPGSPAILWVGRLDANKDPVTVLNAFERVQRQLPRAHLTFVHQRDDLLPLLRRIAASRPSLVAHVHFHGAVPHRDLRAYYSAADVFVLGSHREGSGYAVMEALACGLPTVVTDIPSFRALTGGGCAGALWPPGRADACAEALVRVATRLSETRRIQVRAHFERHLAWPVIGRQALSIYEELAMKRYGHALEPGLALQPVDGALGPPYL
jgi:glycosyltransferase involved in cell wall biosynthesis